MFWLHFAAYFPTAMLGSLYLVLEGKKNSFTAFLDDSAIWFIVYYTGNLGLVLHSTGFLLYLIYVIIEFDSWAYWLLFLLYVGFAAFTQFFHIFEGVEVVRRIQPLWRGTQSGLLWPWLLYYIGLVDKNDQPNWFSDGESEDKITFDY